MHERTGLRLRRIALVVLIASSFSIFSYLTYFGVSMEEELGLRVLFHLRGARLAPSDAVVVTLDRASAGRLGLSDKLHQWPRSILAELVEDLSKAEVSFIAFDLFLREIRDASQDRRLAEAIANSGKVILFSQLTSQQLHKGSAVEELTPPHEIFAKSARAIANFALPRAPRRVNEFWTFRPWNGDEPTVPAVALQLHLIDAYPELLTALSTKSSSNDLSSQADLSNLVRSLRLATGERNIPFTGDKRVDALLSLYTGSDLRYLNFYGPPRTISTIPVADITEKKLSLSRLRGKGVFVGLSDDVASGQEEGFVTVFSREDGLDVSGVEIAATAFLNLLYRDYVQPLSVPVFLVVLLLYGIIVTSAAELFGAALSAVAVLIISFIYLLVATLLFTQSNLWIPFVVPLLIQNPAILLTLFAMRHRSAAKEGKNIRTVLGYYLPKELAEKIDANRKATPAILHEHRFSVCLFTDAASYTTLAEELSPGDLAELLNRYYHRIFTPIRQRGGIVSDVIGDAVMALWASKTPDPEAARKACEAALEIGVELLKFEAENKGLTLFTRIGIHCGEVSMGSVGAGDHLEYRAVGDMVNTASRIQAVTKQLGCKVLLSEDVYNLLDKERFILRPLGRYRLVGKRNPIGLYELIGTIDDSQVPDNRRLLRFAEVLRSVQEEPLDVAIVVLAEFLKDFPDDGPGQFLTEKLLELLEAKKGTNAWDGVIGFDRK